LAKIRQHAGPHRVAKFIFARIIVLGLGFAHGRTTKNIALVVGACTGHATPFREPQSTAARAVIVAWQSGVKHRTKLAPRN
jgi:hypothetical protein